jgi:hypothetical protein
MKSYYTSQREYRKVETPVKKSNVLDVVLSASVMVFFPVVVVYSFFGILCN